MQRWRVGRSIPPSTHGSMEPSELQQKLRASGFGGAEICQGWGKEGLGCSIFRITALCLMGVDFPKQVRSTRRNGVPVVYLVTAASLTRSMAVMSFLISFSLRGDSLCLS